MNSNTQNGSNKTFVEKLIEKRNVTESDSVHPRFGEDPSKEEVEEFQRTYDFFCSFCAAYFAPTLLALRQHFMPGRINHTYTKTCVYCQGPVFEYSINNQNRLYHDCSEKQNTED